MYRQALRSSSRAALPLRHTLLRSSGRRFASTCKSEKPRSWKGSALRWGAAAAAVYYYNTSPIFADEQASSTVPAPPQFSDSDLKTVDAVIEEKRHKNIKTKDEPSAPATPSTSTSEPLSAEQSPPEPGSPEALEEEAGQQGAFNPETGEINWDCPCLGGMAHGPCGEEFKSAFSCFVYSTEEPKGMECIEKFQGMQECFRKYPEIYESELGADDEESDAAAPSLNADGDASPPLDPTESKSSTENKTPLEQPDEKSTETTASEATPAKSSTSEIKPAQAVEAVKAGVDRKMTDATDANGKTD